MAYNWRIIAVTVDDAQTNGTGNWEPFAVAQDDNVGEVILCKAYLEVEDSDKASEVTGGLHENW
jgi:hypothetical protein